MPGLLSVSPNCRSLTAEEVTGTQGVTIGTFTPSLWPQGIHFWFVYCSPEARPQFRGNCIFCGGRSPLSTMEKGGRGVWRPHRPFTCCWSIFIGPVLCTRLSQPTSDRGPVPASGSAVESLLLPQDADPEDSHIRSAFECVCVCAVLCSMCVYTRVCAVCLCV